MAGLFLLIWAFAFLLFALLGRKNRGKFVYGFFARSCGKDTIDIKYEEARVTMTR